MGVVIGVGFTAATPPDELRAALDQALRMGDLTWVDVDAVATTSRRSGHPALVGLPAPVEFHEPASLARVATPHPSTAVAARAGTASVAEAAALRSSAAAQLLWPKRCSARVCTAIARRTDHQFE